MQGHSRFFGLRLVAWAWFVFLASFPCFSEETASDGIQYGFDAPAKLFAIGDVHGDPHALVTILSGLGLMDEKARWTGGNAHLVIMGDIVDKGEDSRTCLDLLYFLVHQAALAGGRVHLLVGNHELDYVHGAPDVPEADKARYADFGEQGLYRAFQDLKSPYARELQTRNTYLRIGTTLFVHGDIGKHLVDEPEDIGYLAELNVRVRRHIAAHQEPRHPDAEVSETLLDKAKSPLCGRALAKKQVSDKDLKAVLRALGVERVVLGHSPTESGDIETDYGDRVWFIDTRISNASAKIRPKGSRLSALELSMGVVAPHYFPRNDQTRWLAQWRDLPCVDLIAGD